MRNVSLLRNPVLEYRPDSSVPVNIAAVASRIAGVLGGELVEQGDPTTLQFTMFLLLPLKNLLLNSTALQAKEICMVE